MDEPPVAPAVNATETSALPPVTEFIVGACGTVVAVTAVLADEADDVPKLFVEVAVYVYWVEDCNPVTTNGLDVPDAVYEPGEEVTVNDNGTPPSVGVLNATDALPLL
jgi:hypothetical protein